MLLAEKWTTAFEELAVELKNFFGKERTNQEHFYFLFISLPIVKAKKKKKQHMKKISTELNTKHAHSQI